MALIWNQEPKIFIKTQKNACYSYSLIFASFSCSLVFIYNFSKMQLSEKFPHFKTSSIFFMKKLRQKKSFNLFAVCLAKIQTILAMNYEIYFKTSPPALIECRFLSRNTFSQLKLGGRGTGIFLSRIVVTLFLEFTNIAM